MDGNLDFTLLKMFVDHYKREMHSSSFPQLWEYNIKTAVSVTNTPKVCDCIAF